MREFTAEEMFDWFKSIFSYCGTALLEMEDEDVMYYLFEELDSDATSCLHINTLKRLENLGYINGQTVALCITFRSRYLELMREKTWSADEIRKHEKWLGLMRIADLIKSTLN
ncbi:MAG: hypothetical protein IJW21_02060 [Clostridia bacterium]|nr:hypothetical protein [Clostridia bacterium]